MSEKKLQDYIPYYIGCRCLNTWFPEGHDQYDNNWILMGFHSGYPKPYCLENDEDTTWTDSIKPILRRLEDITDEEDQEYHKLLLTKELDDYSIRHDCPESFHYLLKQGFDLFGLLDSGVAIDSATLPKIN